MFPLIVWTWLPDSQGERPVSAESGSPVHLTRMVRIDLSCGPCRGAHERHRSPDQAREDAAELVMGIEEELLFDVHGMHKPLTPLLTECAQAAADGHQYTPNPTFLGSTAVGGADADLAIAHLLVDIKTREQITNHWIRDTLFQLLGYTLLDIDASHGIRRVAILLPRQPHIAIWSLDDVFGRDADEALPELREEFASLLLELMQANSGETKLMRRTAISRTMS